MCDRQKSSTLCMMQSACTVSAFEPHKWSVCP
jgi:hypothetical protein